MVMVMVVVMVMVMVVVVVVVMVMVMVMMVMCGAVFVVLAISDPPRIHKWSSQLIPERMVQETSSTAPAIGPTG